MWNAYVFIAPHHSKHFRLPDGGGDSDLAFDLHTVNVTETQYRLCTYICVIGRGQGQPLYPQTQSQCVPRGHLGCLRVYRGGKIVKLDVCGQSKRGKESDLIKKRACRRVRPAEAAPGA